MSIQYQIIEQKKPHDMILHGEEVNKLNQFLCLNTLIEFLKFFTNRFVITMNSAWKWFGHQEWDSSHWSWYATKISGIEFLGAKSSKCCFWIKKIHQDSFRLSISIHWMGNILPIQFVMKIKFRLNSWNRRWNSWNSWKSLAIM